MKISKAKTEKIKENVLAFLYSKAPQPLFTSDIAHDLARDEEFILKLLNEMERKKLVVRVKKNPEGISYLKRNRWRISSNVFEAYDKIAKQKIDYSEKENYYSFE